MSAKRINVYGNITNRERQIINGVLATHMTALYATFGREGIKRGISTQDQETALLSVKAFAETTFPDLEFRIEE